MLLNILHQTDIYLNCWENVVWKIEKRSPMKSGTDPKDGALN